VVADPDAPTLAEVRELLDAPLEQPGLEVPPPETEVGVPPPTSVQSAGQPPLDE
jgi:hypothetical protein